MDMYDPFEPPAEPSLKIVFYGQRTFSFLTNGLLFGKFGYCFNAIIMKKRKKKE